MRHHPPGWTSVSANLDDSFRETSGQGDYELVNRQRNVAALELASYRQLVGCNSSCVSLNDIGNNEKLESLERPSKALGLRQRPQWIPSQNDKSMQIACFNLVRQG